LDAAAVARRKLELTTVVFPYDVGEIIIAEDVILRSEATKNLVGGEEFEL
jgi:hypothetical protein